MDGKGKAKPKAQEYLEVDRKGKGSFWLGIGWNGDEIGRGQDWQSKLPLYPNPWLDLPDPGLGNRTVMGWGGQIRPRGWVQQ